MDCQVFSGLWEADSWTENLCGMQDCWKGLFGQGAVTLLLELSLMHRCQAVSTVGFEKGKWSDPTSNKFTQ